MKNFFFNNKKYLLLIFYIAVVAAIILSLFLIGWTKTWSFLFVPTLQPYYADLRTVQGLIFSMSHGFDPYFSNPGDPWGRTLNYPSIWIFIANIFSLHLEWNYLIFVSAYVFVYIIICLFLIYKYPSICLLLIILSGSSLLAIERGNIDLIIFNLLYISSVAPIFLSLLLIIFATILKIYPIFSIISIYNNKKILLFSLLIASLYFASRVPELLKIINNTPVSSYISYGAPSIAKALANKLYGLTSFKIITLLNHSLLIAFFLIAIAFVVGKNKEINSLFQCKLYSENELKLFLIGSSIYLFTFIISSNWDYRLIFLIFCIPFINKIKKNFSRFYLLALILIASNQSILIRLFSHSSASFLSILSKCLLFIALIWIIQSNFGKFIKRSKLKY
jgi:hypothetical protein